MKVLKKIGSKLRFKEFLADESGQGMTEYILLVVVVLGLAMLFKNKIRAAIDGKMGEVDKGLQGFAPE